MLSKFLKDIFIFQMYLRRHERNTSDNDLQPIATRSAVPICKNKWLNADHDRKNIPMESA